MESSSLRFAITRYKLKERIDLTKYTVLRSGCFDCLRVHFDVAIKGNELEKQWSKIIMLREPEDIFDAAYKANRYLKAHRVLSDRAR